jgi:hypothetical protein
MSHHSVGFINRQLHSVRLQLEYQHYWREMFEQRLDVHNDESAEHWNGLCNLYSTFADYMESSNVSESENRFGHHIRHREPVSNHL